MRDPKMCVNCLHPFEDHNDMQGGKVLWKGGKCQQTDEEGDCACSEFAEFESIPAHKLQGMADAEEGDREYRRMVEGL